MALTTDGEFLLTVNNAAEAAAFATLFAGDGDRNHSSVRELTRITIDPDAFPGSAAIEQPAWDPKTRRFYVSVPILGTGGCKDAHDNTITCDGGMMVIDPANFTPGNMVLGAFDPARTEASCNSPTADPTAPRSDRMTTCYWLHRGQQSDQPEHARQSTRRLGISSMWAGSSGRTKSGSTKAWAVLHGLQQELQIGDRVFRPMLRTKLPCWGGRRGNQLPDRDDSAKLRLALGWRPIPSATSSSSRKTRRQVPAETRRTWARGFAGATTGVSASSCIMSATNGDDRDRDDRDKRRARSRPLIEKSICPDS